MAVLNLKNVPDDLMDRIKARATAHHRPVSGEVLSILGRALEDEGADPMAALDAIRAFRVRYRAEKPGPTVQELLDEDRGR